MEANENIYQDKYDDAQHIFNVAADALEVLTKKPTKPSPTIPKVDKVVPTPPEAAIKPYSTGSKVKVGRSPQVNTIVKELPATKEEIALGERFFEIKNDKTGEINTVEFGEIKSIKTRIKEKLAEEKGELTLREPEAFEGSDNKVWQDMKEARQSAKELRKISPKKIYQSLKVAVVDVSGNIKTDLLKHGPAGKKAVMHRDLIAGAHSKALKDVNDVTKEIYGGLSSRDHDYLDAYINAQRSIEIARNKPDFKFTKGRTVADYEQVLKDIPPDIMAKIKPSADRYWAEMDGQLKQLLKEGLLTPESYKTLSEQGRFYSPRQVLDYIDPEKTYNVAGKKITVPDSGINKLTEEGSLKQIEVDTSLLLSQVIERTQTRLFRNRANKALYELAKTDPENKIIKLAKVTKVTKDGKTIYQPAPHGWDKVSAMVEGKPVEMLMPSNMAKEWIKSDPILNNTTAQAIGYVSGTKVLKAMATGLNPEFALSNFPRDLAHVWLTTSEYSKHGPAAALQMGKDLSSVFKDAFTRKGSYIDYIDEGGGMEFLTHQGRFAPKIKGHLGKLQDIMGYFGETSEVLVRLALRERALRNGASSQEATWIARNYLDFSQGGNFIKAADSAIPYLNAGIQGTRGLARAAIKNPAEFAYKVAQIGSIATGLYYANKFHNPEAYEQVPAYDKVNNWIITTPFSFEDKDGNKKWVYFKISKDQGQRGMASVFEGLAQKAIGEDVDVDQIQKSVVETIPIMPSNLMPPTLEAIWGYAANKDFWKNEDIWRGPKIEPSEEYTKYTPEALKEIGKATDMSPERLRYALSQFFTRGNIWTSMVGYGWKQLLDELPEADRNKVTQELILNKPFIRRIAKTTDPYYQYGKEIEETKIKSSTERYIATRNFDKMAARFIDGEIDRKEIMAYIKEQPINDRKRLVVRLKRHQRLSDLPERRYWLDLLSIAPEARANLFWNRWRDLDDEGKKKLEKQAQKIPNFYSGKFNKRFSELKKK